jgi:hypothetical protein
MSSAVLPSVGVEVESDCRVSGAAVTLRSKPVLVDFGGECRIAVEAGDGADAVATRLTGLRLTGELPDAGGPEDGGTIVLELDEAAANTETGLLRPLPDVPSRFANDLVGACALTVHQPDSTVRAVARNPVRLSAARTAFPPSGDEYRLVEPVDFTLPEAPDVTIARVEELVVRLDPK